MSLMTTYRQCRKKNILHQRGFSFALLVESGLISYPICATALCATTIRQRRRRHPLYLSNCSSRLECKSEKKRMSPWRNNVANVSLFYRRGLRKYFNTLRSIVSCHYLLTHIRYIHERERERAILYFYLKL